MRQVITISVLLLVPLFFLYGCDNDTSNGVPVGTAMTCIGCHSSQEMLEAALEGKVEDSKVLVPNKGDG
jgi:hypothetical protein